MTARAQESKAAASSSPTPDVGYWKQEWGTGAWGGARTKLRTNGVELDVRLTQSYQGVTTNAPMNQGGYGGKFDTNFGFDLNKLARWQGLSGQVITETRFGDIPPSSERR